MATTYLPYSGPGYPDYSAINASVQSGLAGLVQALHLHRIRPTV